MDTNNDRFSNLNTPQSIVENKCGGSGSVNDIPNTTALIDAIDKATAENGSVFLIPLTEDEQGILDELSEINPAFVHRGYESLFDVAAALNKFSNIFNIDSDEYDVLFIIWHGLYTEYITKNK